MKRGGLPRIVYLPGTEPPHHYADIFADSLSAINLEGAPPIDDRTSVELECCRIVLAHGEDDRRTALEAILVALGHEVMCSAATQLELVGAGISDDVDVIVTAVRLAEGDGIDALLEIERHGPRPAVVITEHDDMGDVEKALADHVMAYLTEPVGEDDLRPTIHLVRRRFQQFEDLRAEVDDLRAALAARKVIEKAKGRLMERHELSEDDAYHRLQKMATSRRIKMLEVAEAILLADDVDGELDGGPPGEPRPAAS